MKSAVRTLSLLGLLLLSGCGSQMQNTFKVQANLKQAEYYAQLNQTPQARQWADRAVAVDPNALSTYLSTAAGDPDENVTSIADIFEASGDEATLRDYMKQAASKFPDDYRPLKTLDDTYGLLGDIPNQRATATALAALLEKKIATPGSQHDKDLTLVLAQAYCDASNLTKCAADYNAVLNADHNDPVALNGLAYAYAVANSTPDLPQARALAQQALVSATRARAPDEFVGAVRDTLGWVQYRQNDLPDALSNIQAAVNIAPRNAEERYHLGMVYEALHQPDAARAEFTHAALLAQGYAAPQQQLSLLKETSPAATGTATPLTAQH